MIPVISICMLRNTRIMPIRRSSATRPLSSIHLRMLAELNRMMAVINQAMVTAISHRCHSSGFWLMSSISVAITLGPAV